MAGPRNMITITLFEVNLTFIPLQRACSSCRILFSGCFSFRHFQKTVADKAHACGVDLLGSNVRSAIPSRTQDHCPRNSVQERLSRCENSAFPIRNDEDCEIRHLGDWERRAEFFFRYGTCVGGMFVYGTRSEKLSS